MINHEDPSLQVDSPELDNGMEGNEDRSTEQSDSSCYSGIREIFGDQLILPRVGDEYQAQIPPQMKDYDYLHSVSSPITEATAGVSGSFLLRLPIPVMWTHDQEKHNKPKIMEVYGSRDAGVSGENHSSGYEAPKVGHLDSTLSNGEEVWVSTNSHPMEGVEINVGIESQKEEMALNHMGKCLVPLPGCLGKSWSNIEHDGFILGLYIFGKNLLLVKRFIGCKGMGDIQSFYYGKFYKSDEHRRWSECRKTRSRKSIHGQKIFTGWRQQEVLSRMFSEVSEECRNMLLEARPKGRVGDSTAYVSHHVSRSFAEEKISLEEYVFTLSDAVGIKKLIEAVGIGKGKLDLTGSASETTKTKYDFTIRRKIPIGKACSSLTSEDIIKLLTGDFRLSKARTNDLFWEAVWPRLLARGWHSEQPKDYVFTGSKHCLVFLAPGVNKFSRRKLVKGNDYFDSLQQVLNKVAAEPKLLELGSDAEMSSEKKEEENKDAMIKQAHDSVSSKRNKQSVGYLKPRISSCSQEVMKFTIVDTSLADSEERLKIRELRTLPNEKINVSPASSHSSETKQGASEINKKSGDSNENMMEEIETEEFDSLSSSPDVGQSVPYQDDSSQNLLSASFLAEDKDMLDVNDEAIHNENPPCTQSSDEEGKLPGLSDRNLPHVPPASEAGDHLGINTIENSDKDDLSSFSVIDQHPRLLKTSDAGTSTEQRHPLTNGRRQSTRNRPLSTKALEALNCEFLTSNRRRKALNAQSSRKVRGRNALGASFRNNVDNATAETKI
ncbi:hypothetical protein RJ641_030924, partial [Dillenia turbinata]